MEDTSGVGLGNVGRREVCAVEGGMIRTVGGRYEYEGVGGRRVTQGVCSGGSEGKGYGVMVYVGGEVDWCDWHRFASPGSGTQWQYAPSGSGDPSILPLDRKSEGPWQNSPLSGGDGGGGKAMH